MNLLFIKFLMIYKFQTKDFLIIINKLLIFIVYVISNIFIFKITLFIS